MIEKSHGHKTKDQTIVGPEPVVLMQGKQEEDRSDESAGHRGRGKGEERLLVRSIV